MLTRGALYIVFPGNSRVEAALARSIESLSAVHPELPVHIERMPEGSSLLDKARMYDISPFDETVFLDADTVVLGRLDHGFDKAAQHGLACCICECPWARRYGAFSDRGDMIEYNTGVLFFGQGSERVFDGWQRCIAVDSSIRFMRGNELAVMPFNDQAGFAEAIEQSEFNPFILPMNWNFRPIWQHTAFGPIKIWHDYSEVPDGVLDWNEQQSKPDAVIGCARVQR
jgi:hypothetical protein